MFSLGLKKSIISFLVLAIFVGCSGISMIEKGVPKGIYGDKFLELIGSVKEQYKQGQTDAAMTRLKAMNEEKLLPSERALRRNLIGVIFFAKENYEQSIFNFDLALATSRLDKSLTAQIYLNLASSYYKLGFMDKSFSTLSISDFRYLHKSEAKKYHKLNYTLAIELDRPGILLKSLVWYLSEKNKISEIKSEPLYEQLLETFFKRSHSEKLRLLEEFDEKKFLIVGYLAYMEVEKLYYKGEKSEAKSLLDWTKDNFSHFPEIESLVTNFVFRIENYTKMDQFSLGVVLPMSGTRKKFGERALMGIDSGLRDFNAKNGDKKAYTMHLVDSKGSGAVGAYRVKELIEKNYVSVIIGGLFSGEATKEYLEAKKHGVFFISLSQIYLPKEQKDHLLLEIPGSVESQVGRVFSKDFMNFFGDRGSIIYPNSSRGEAYVNEFWRRAKQEKIKVTGVQSYDKNATDHRGTVQKLLGLKFKRERQEELDLLAEVHSLEKSRSTRRIQTLKPLVDFDWVFMPAFPQEAMQLIPSFTYYDAFKMNLIGGPSWRSKQLSKESSKLGRLYFVGDNVKPEHMSFTNNFIERYQRKPRLIEMRAYDSFKIVHDLLTGEEFSTRDELDMTIRGRENLSGLTGVWHLDDGVWLKEMLALKMRRGKIEKLFDDTQEAKKEIETEK
jgi:ABC-type branched-subunit amino acid transport system substrate-binding protein